MSYAKYDLISASDAENIFGKKLFYRQKIYRFEKANKIKGFLFRGQTLFLGSQILKAVIIDLADKIESRYPGIKDGQFQIAYNDKTKTMTIDGLHGSGITIDTDTENEEDTLYKAGLIVEGYQQDIDSVLDDTTSLVQEQPIQDELLATVLPEELLWVKLTVKEIEDVEVRSMVLVSLSTVAQYVGVESYKFTDWLRNGPYAAHILSIHHKQIHDPGKPGAWKKGVTPGYTSFIPFELLPEVLVAFRNSRLSVGYPARAEQLYQLASNTLRVVGLAVSGNKEEAAVALAEVGEGLGLDVADQIIGVMKQYATREYQVQTQKEFSSKVKQLKGDYAVVTGTLTLGITKKTAGQWRLEGNKQGLPKSKTTSAREVMRRISPGDGVGMTFGERHFIKQPNTDEAIRTGKEGKNFYERLKRVGLLDDVSPKKGLDS